MRPVSFNVPRLALAPALVFALAACGNGGTGVDRLTPEEVGGTYEICSLVFTPQQALLPAVDVRTSAIDTSPQATLRASLRLRSDATTFDLRYTTPPPADDIVQHSGTYQLGASTATLVFTGTAAQRAALLLPNRLDLEFQAQPKQLTTLATPAAYPVLRTDYARLANITETGLAPEIPGTLNARFAVGSCE